MMNEQKTVGEIRPIVARYVITGKLVLKSACHLGRESEGIVDMELIRDKLEGKPLLTGASIAGALRNYLTDFIQGYSLGNQKEVDEPKEVKELFGSADEDLNQSALIVFDNRGELPEKLYPEIRDGIAINASTGTAEEHAKFDYEVLPPGTSFDLRFDLIVPSKEKEKELLEILLIALTGLEKGEIRLGAKKNRGLGECQVTSWKAYKFNLTTPQGWLEWIDQTYYLKVANSKSFEKVKDALSKVYGAPLEITTQDKRKSIKFKLDLHWQNSGILIRSKGFEVNDHDNVHPKSVKKESSRKTHLQVLPDDVHLRSAGKDIVSGTSLAGVMRARAIRIAQLFYEKSVANEIVNSIFGSPKEEKEKRKRYSSRIIINESEITDGKRLVPSRVKIDRFTNATIDGALFDEQPVYGGKTSIDIEIKNYQNYMIGLLLLVLKDLITGDLAIGGTSSVGRGFARGSVQIQVNGLERPIIWKPDQKMNKKDIELLEKSITAFKNYKPSED